MNNPRLLHIAQIFGAGWSAYCLDQCPITEEDLLNCDNKSHYIAITPTLKQATSLTLIRLQWSLCSNIAMQQIARHYCIKKTGQKTVLTSFVIFSWSFACQIPQVRFWLNPVFSHDTLQSEVLEILKSMTVRMREEMLRPW